MPDSDFNKPGRRDQDNNENVVDLGVHRQVRLNRQFSTSLFDRTKAARVRQGGRSRVAQPTREEIDAKISASEAKTDVKFAELQGDIKLIAVQISTLISEFSTIKNDNKATRTTVINTGIALFAALIGVASIASAFWYNGTVVFDHVQPH